MDQRQPRPLAEQRRARAVDGRAARATPPHLVKFNPRFAAPNSELAARAARPPHPRRSFVDDEAEADGGDDREAAA